MEAENYPHHSRLLLDLNPALQQRIESAATERGISLKDYIEELLERDCTLLYKSSSKKTSNEP